ncbi:MAG TPA: SDR family NAD(P)-dependent oxidoreductase [Polyangiaceae bacterium]|nr:SDR family NAD(P)-dependent oxidoreductase [Polyangiaceae bacterium]
MMRPDNPTLQGKTVLITGGARGIGREAATQIAALGARVVVVARDEKKAQEELAHMRKTGGAFDLLVADLASLDSVRRAAAEYRSRFGALDVLINNAAVNVHSRQTTQDGLELHFGVNYLSHYLLTRLLIDLLALAAPSRIVTTGAMQFGAVIDFNDLQLERGWGNTKSITRAKMGLFLFSRELSRRYPTKELTANVADPGMVKTGYHERASWAQRVALKLFGTGPEEAAATITYLASSPEVAGVSGALFAKCKQVPWKGQALDEAAAKRLWDESARLVGLSP